MPNLYVTEPGAIVQKEYERLVVAKRGEILLDVPALNIENVVLVGPINVTMPALTFMLQRRIGLVMLDSSGKFRGRLVGDVPTVVHLRRAQYEKSRDLAFRLEFARQCVLAKVHNSRALCMRMAMSGRNKTAALSVERIGSAMTSIPSATDLPGLRAVEAQAARAHFRALRGHLREGWAFPSRQRRPPPDPVNVLLSAAYTLLGEAINSALILAGLDPYCGFYHSERSGRPALALDLMEEFRPLIADSVVLTLINKRIIVPGDFKSGPPERPVILSSDGYRKILVQFGVRLRTPVLVPGTDRRTTYERAFEFQARRVASTLTGKQAAYVGFRTR